MLISTLKKLVELCADDDEFYVRTVDDGSLLEIDAILIEIENDSQDRRDLVISVKP